MIKDCGVDWVILGHSERRHVFGESDEVILNGFYVVVVLVCTRLNQCLSKIHIKPIDPRVCVLCCISSLVRRQPMLWKVVSV